MKVLNLVTTPRPFFDNQVQVLRDMDVEMTTLQVPGRETQQETRSLTDYLRFYPRVLRHSVGEYDLIHANFGFTAPYALGQLKLPIVLSLWGSDLMGKYGTVSDFCSRYADAVILPARSMAPYLSTEYTLIPFGVDPDKFKPIDKKIARNEVGWDQEKNIVLFPYDKSRDIKQFNVAQSVVDNIDEQIKLQALSEVPHDRMPIYMNASDAILVTSRRESGPMVVKEAAFCNIPVVSTDVGFVSNVLSDVKNSYVCSSQEELEERLEAVIRSGKRSDGRKHSNEWGLDKMGQRLVNVYDSVLEK